MASGARWSLVALGALLWSSSASAATRFVLAMAEPANVYVDGQLVHAASAGPRLTTQLTAGKHLISLTDMAGAKLYTGTIDVPDNAEVKASYARGSGMSVAGTAATVQEGEAGYAVADEGDPDLSEVEDSFDMNEGTPNPQRSSEDRYAGDAQAWGNTVSTVGRVAGTATGVGGPVVTTVAPAAISGAASVVRNAEAGGTSALGRSGSGSSWRQGRPIPPAAKTGTLTLEHTGEAPITIYVEGFEVANLEGASKGKLTLEVGAHSVQIWHATNRAILYEGRVKIEEGVTVPVVFSETAAPRATDRAWLWSLR